MHDRLERLAEAGRPRPLVWQRVGGTVGGHGPLAAQDLADDVDVLAGPGERLGERLAVPPLHDLRAGDAEPEREPAAGQVVERHGAHRCGGGRARGQLHDGGGQADVLGERPVPGQRGERVRTPGLRGEDGVEARPVRGHHEVGVIGGRLGAPVAELQGEFHAHSVTHAAGSACPTPRKVPHNRVERVLLTGVTSREIVVDITPPDEPVLSASLTPSFDYTRSTGPVLGAFFTGLRDRTIVGNRDSEGTVHVPPVEYDPHTREPITELVELGSGDELGGVVVAWTWVPTPTDLNPLDTPFAWALVRFDGADTAMLLPLAADGPDAVSTGM